MGRAGSMVISRPSAANLSFALKTSARLQASTADTMAIRKYPRLVNSAQVSELYESGLVRRTAPATSDSQLCCTQPQGIGNHRYRAETHCSSGDHRVQEQPEAREQHTCCKRYSDGVVDKSEEQILSNIEHG